MLLCESYVSEIVRSFLEESEQNDKPLGFITR